MSRAAEEEEELSLEKLISFLVTVLISSSNPTEEILVLQSNSYTFTRTFNTCVVYERCFSPSSLRKSLNFFCLKRTLLHFIPLEGIPLVKPALACFCPFTDSNSSVKCLRGTLSFLPSLSLGTSGWAERAQSQQLFSGQVPYHHGALQF